jgi:RNA 3'-terminal phosphate cyclase (ATP)
MIGMLKLDGSVGEGGGQILRTALALSALTGQPFEIEKIRANRKKPGLMRQHLTAVRAAAEVCQAKVEGDNPGSMALCFVPGAVRAGEYAFAVGTAGSATLVLQTVLPPLLTASGPSKITVEGGTHNPMAPPFDFLDRSFLPLVRRMGPKVDVRLERWGFYPAGGGRISVAIEPVRHLQSFELLERESILKKSARAIVANLSRSIAERELQLVQERLGIERASLVVEELKDVQGPGNVLTIELAMSHHSEIISGFGERGVPAGTVAADAVDEARDYLASELPVGRHLADQLVIPLAMSGGGGFRTGPPSRHALTNIEVVQKFLPTAISCRAYEQRKWEVRVGETAPRVQA